MLCQSRPARRLAIDSLISVLSCDEKEAELEDAQARGDRDGVKVLDPQSQDFFLVVLDRDLEEIPVLGLQEEEECALWMLSGSVVHDTRTCDVPSSCASPPLR